MSFISLKWEIVNYGGTEILEYVQLEGIFSW